MFDKLFRKTPEPSVDVVPAVPVVPLTFEMKISRKNREHDYWVERKARQREIEERKLNIKPCALGEDILQHLKKIRDN
jgi:hypothetical protein